MAVPRILTLALSCAAASAWASPRTDPTLGRAVFTGATMPHATSLGLDPAALGLSTVDQLYLAFTGVVDQVGIALAPPAGGAPGPRITSTELGPGGMIAFLYHLAGDSLTVGFAAQVVPPESFPAETAWKYHVASGAEHDVAATVGASYKVADIFYAGASLSHQNTLLRLRYARDAAFETCIAAPCPAPGDPATTEDWDVDVRSPWLSTSNLRVNVGALLQITQNVWFGLGYHTPPGFGGVQTELTGKARIARPGVDKPLELESVVEIQFPASADAELRVRLPADLDLHVGGRWEDLSRLSAYDVRAYNSTSVANGVPEWTERPRGMHDAFAGWAGVEQVDRGQTWLFGGRAGFETAALRSSRTSPLTISPRSLTLDAGAQLRLPGGLIAQLSYGLQYFPTVDVATSAFDPTARDACIASSFDYTDPGCATLRNGYAIASAAGTYDRIQHALRIGLRYDLP